MFIKKKTSKSLIDDKINRLDLRKCLDFMMASTIFLLAILELISWRLSFGEMATITDQGNGYLVKWYPLLSTIGYFIVSSFFLAKIIIFKSCIYTKVITVIYFIIQSFNIMAFIFMFGIDFYNIYISPIFLCTIISLIVIKAIRWGSQKLS